MPAFLKVENPGIAPIEGFTVLGVSLANTSSNAGVIGQFGSGNILTVAYLFIRWIAARMKLQLLGVGLLWVVLTVLFEIGLGRFVLGLPWERITEDYNPARGGFLGFGLLFMAVSPLLAVRLRGK